MRILDELSMNRCHLFGLQVSLTASNTLATLWLKQSQQFPLLETRCKSSALALVRPRCLIKLLRSFWLGYYAFSLLNSTSEVVYNSIFSWIYNDLVGFTISSLTDLLLVFWGRLPSVCGYGKLRAVWHRCNGRRMVQAHDDSCILATLMFGRVHHAEIQVAFRIKKKATYSEMHLFFYLFCDQKDENLPVFLLK